MCPKIRTYMFKPNFCFQRFCAVAKGDHVTRHSRTDGILQ